jgi:DNA invertase Pin-like site-specific DNA recombinase
MSNSPSKGLLIGYARTSTTEQEAGLRAQVRDLHTASCTKIFQEQVSSIAELERALDYVRGGARLSSQRSTDWPAQRWACGRS